MSDTKATTGKVEKSEAEWRRELSPMQYAVLRERRRAAVSRANTSDEQRKGHLYLRRLRPDAVRIRRKFDSGCGWPKLYPRRLWTAMSTRNA